MGIPVYIPTEWVNGRAPAINDKNLNKIEKGMQSVTDEAIKLRDNPTKAQETIPGVSRMWITDGDTLNIYTQ